MRQHQPNGRPGFTLIELLIVIAIIAVLIALVSSAAFRVMGSSLISTTRTILTRLEERLRHQWTVKADRGREAVIPDPPPLTTPASFTYLTNPKILAGMKVDIAVDPNAK